MDQTTQAAAEANAARDRRMQLQQSAIDARSAKQTECDNAKAEIASRPADPVLKPEAAKKWRDGLMAAKVLECDGAAAAGGKPAIVGAIQSAYDAVIAEGKKRDPLLDPVVTPPDGTAPVDPIETQRLARVAAADALIHQAYIDGIKESIDELHKEYRDAKNARASKAATESGFGGFYGAHLDLVDGYFTKDWAGDALTASTARCTEILWHPSTGTGRRRTRAVFNDPSVDNVDDQCVHVGLVTHLKGYIGTAEAPQ